MLFRRVILTCALAVALSTASASAAGTHQRDFDFEFGSWRVHLSRLVHPLSGSHTWIAYDGTSIVHPVWNGKANYGEFDVSGPSGRIVGMSLRLFDPKADSWAVRWVNQADGELTPPLVGRFEHGVGRFYDHEMYNGHPIMARFLFSSLTRDSFRLEQAFSPDGGQSWETNWVTTFTRVASTS